MSLVSALPERTKQQDPAVTSNSNNNNNSNSVHPKIYQKTGEPLSKEALYRAKMKYGYYQSPASTTSIGVPDSRTSADAAAHLANVNHVAMPTYVRDIAPDAKQAARNIGKRKPKTHGSLTKTRGSDMMTMGSASVGSASAASKAYSMSYIQSPLVDRDNDNESVSRTYSISSAASATRGVKSGKRGDDKQGRTQSLSTPRPNMKKVFNNAERKAESSIKQRSSPSKQNYGVVTSSSNVKKIDHDVMKKVMNKSSQSKERKDREQRARDEIDKKNQRVALAKNAAVKVKDTNFSEQIDKEIANKKHERDVYLKQLTSSQVMSMARAKVDQQMKLIEIADAENRLYVNDDYNHAAVSIAQKNQETRSQARANYSNKVNLGGGLWLSPEDINKISYNLVSPVLGEISDTAQHQRDTDVEIQTRTKNYNNSLNRWKKLQSEKEANDVKIMNDMKQRHDDEWNRISKELLDQYNKLKLDLQSQLDEKKKDLATTNEIKENLIKDNETDLQNQQGLANKEVDSWQKYQDNDLDHAKLEQDEIIKPYNDQLSKSNAHQDELSNEYDNIMANMTKLQTVIDDHKDKIEEYNQLMVVQEGREDREESLLNHLVEDKTELNSEIENDIMIRAQRVKESLELANKEYELKQLEICAMINQRENDLQKIDISLQEERLKLLDSMQNVSRARGDEKLDEEKIKVLFGMTSDEFMEQQGIKKVEPITEEETATATAPDEGEAATTTAPDETINDEPSFSGFSQGSINNEDEDEDVDGNNDNEEEDEHEEHEEENVDRSSPGKSDDTGYFKEVF